MSVVHSTCDIIVDIRAASNITSYNNLHTHNILLLFENARCAVAGERYIHIIFHHVVQLHFKLHIVEVISKFYVFSSRVLVQTENDVFRRSNVLNGMKTKICFTRCIHIR